MPTLKTPSNSIPDSADSLLRTTPTFVSVTGMACRVTSPQLFGDVLEQPRGGSETLKGTDVYPELFARGIAQLVHVQGSIQ